MVAIELPQSPIVSAIFENWRITKNEALDDERLRCSNFGNPCERALWYAFRWVSKKEMFEGRMLRLFDTGKLEESRLIADLRNIGCEVRDADPETGEQLRVTWHDGLFGGSIDGEVLNLPGAEKTWHVVEFKTHNDKSFKDLQKKGVGLAKPFHYVQMILYMEGRGMSRALYMAKNKNTDEIYVERVHADPAFAATLIARAGEIIRAIRPPPRKEDWYCRGYRGMNPCQHLETCRPMSVKDYQHQVAPLPRVNCRTCMFSDIRNGKFFCGSTGEELSFDRQRKACPSHRYIDALVHGSQIDADEELMIVTYERPDGSTWVDGLHDKPKADEP